MERLIIDSIKDTYDDAMKDYIDSSEYKEGRKRVNTMFQELRRKLTPEQAACLNDILNAVDNSNNLLALESYSRGVVLGMSVHDRYAEVQYS